MRLESLQFSTYYSTNAVTSTRRKRRQAFQDSELQLHLANAADLVVKTEMKKKLVQNTFDWDELSKKDQKKLIENT